MLRIALCQINPWVGQLAFNLSKIKNYYEAALAQDKDLIIFPECALTGYPLEDLVLKPSFIKKVSKNVKEICQWSEHSKTALLIGTPWKIKDTLLNCALLIHQGEIQEIIEKQILPNSGVFDEKRVFQPGFSSTLINLQQTKLGILICEDMWSQAPARTLKEKGAECLIVLNGSPYEQTKHPVRLQQARSRVAETGLPLVYLNLVGGQDSLVFDGRSFILDSNQMQLGELPAYEEGLYPLDVIKQEGRLTLKPAFPSETFPEHDELCLIYRALVTSLQDYIAKNNFNGVLLGLSGGIDSALSSAIAVDALGAEKVFCVMMPSPYTSQESLEDAKATTDLLKFSYDIIPITSAMEALNQTLADTFKNQKQDTTEENIQARLRGIILMALSNKLGFMVLSTGNKSELAVGYATLYGDMCGGFNVLKDVYKTQVFALARWRNCHHHPSFKGPRGSVIPERVITKAPSAELKPNQKDQDTLPPYEELDFILSCLIENEASLEDIAHQGFKVETISYVEKLLTQAEYKRRQAPPGPKVTPKALIFDRRYPITNGYSED